MLDFSIRLDALLAIGALLIIAAVALGDWPLRLLTLGLALVVGGLYAAWSDQR